MPAPRIHFTDGEYCIGFWNNIALVDTLGEIDVARMRQLAEAYKQLLKRYRHIAVLCVLRAGAPLSSGPARAESAKMANELGDALTRVAFVIEEAGVFAQLFRTVIRGFNQLTRSTKLTVDLDLEDAVRSLAPLVLTNGDRANVSHELKEAFVALRTLWTPTRAR